MSAVSPKPTDSGALHVVVFSAAGGLMIGALAMMYAVALARHAWPAADPWCAVAIVSFVVMAYSAAIRSEKPGKAVGVAVAMGVLATACFVVATIAVMP